MPARQLSLFEPAPPVAVRRPPTPPGERTRFVVLGSGSSGNCVLVESAGQRLLVDAGFPCRELERRLRSVGVDPRSVQAVLLTHEHGDHCRGASRFAWRHRVPVYATPGTLRGMALRRFADARAIRPGERLEVAGLVLETMLVSHDARQPIGLVLEDEDGRRLGVVADLGEARSGTWDHLRDLSALVLEANHDLEMLRTGPYPWPLKRRVASARGHLSNGAAANGAARVAADGLHTVVLYHLSRINNLPALAYDAVAAALERAGSAARVELSEQFEPTPWFAV